MDITSYLLGKKASGGGGSGGLDWSAIGYESTPQSVVDNYNYSKIIYDNWENVSDLGNRFYQDNDLVIMPLVDTSKATTTIYMFRNCNYLTTIPLLNTSNVTSMNGMFNGCYRLRDVPLLNTSKVSTMNSTFSNCSYLTDTSLDNILKMCINATSYTGVKTLAKIGFTSSTIEASRIQALPSYQNFIDAGWTIGY